MSINCTPFLEYALQVRQSCVHLVNCRSVFRIRCIPISCLVVSTVSDVFFFNVRLYCNKINNVLGGGGGEENWVHAKFGMAKFGVVKIWYKIFKYHGKMWYKSCQILGIKSGTSSVEKQYFYNSATYLLCYSRFKVGT